MVEAIAVAKECFGAMVMVKELTGAAVKEWLGVKEGLGCWSW